MFPTCEVVGGFINPTILQTERYQFGTLLLYLIGPDSLMVVCVEYVIEHIRYYNRTGFGGYPKQNGISYPYWGAIYLCVRTIYCL